MKRCCKFNSPEGVVGVHGGSSPLIAGIAGNDRSAPLSAHGRPLVDRTGHAVRAATNYSSRTVDFSDGGDAMKLAECSHLKPLVDPGRAPVAVRTQGCEECLEIGDRWVHLRLCMACGHVGCCNDSPNRHAAAHFRSCGHQVIKSYEPGESWVYCYEDDAFLGSIPVLAGEEPAHHISAPIRHAYRP